MMPSPVAPVALVALVVTAAGRLAAAGPTCALNSGLSGGPEKMKVTATAPHFYTWPECVNVETESYNYSKHGNL